MCRRGVDPGFWVGVWGESGLGVWVVGVFEEEFEFWDIFECYKALRRDFDDCLKN